VQIEEPQLVIDAIGQAAEPSALKSRRGKPCQIQGLIDQNYTKAVWHFLVRSRRIG
jgi:hypothetical protein